MHPIASSRGNVQCNFCLRPQVILYAVASRGEVTIYRQPWKGGNTRSAPGRVDVPSFPLEYAAGNAYDFSGDLSTIVYVRPAVTPTSIFKARNKPWLRK